MVIHWFVVFGAGFVIRQPKNEPRFMVSWLNHTSFATVKRASRFIELTHISFSPIQKHPNFDGGGDSPPVYERHKCILISPSPLGEW
jgi:hypothetical protein